ncbi:MAG: helix-turn-helix transcriptional regulator [Actinomycetota bacterium]|nr:helix-turn-helix transcriptional regulator [Actinomycetota bacterium]
MSQEALAHACARHPTYISLLERGKNSPSLKTLFLLAEALRCRPSEIVRDVENQLKS